MTTITSGHGFSLDPKDAARKPPVGKAEALQRLGKAAATIAERQSLMMARQSWSLLAIFQGTDAAGKDGTISHVFDAVNPAGIRVTSFKQPSDEEHRHDFLWRIHQAVPPAGLIGVFNRSQYEEVMVTRVHTKLLSEEHLPPEINGPDIWEQRMSDIVHFEHMLARNGTVVHKFFLHLSRKEQRKRLLERLDDTDKHWKFSPSDLAERPFWNTYQTVYSEAIRATATKHAPWHVIPADHKWYARMLVAEILAASMEGLDLKTPASTKAEAEARHAARKALHAES